MLLPEALSTSLAGPWGLLSTSALQKATRVALEPAGSFPSQHSPVERLETARHQPPINQS